MKVCSGKERLGVEAAYHRNELEHCTYKEQRRLATQKVTSPCGSVVRV